MLHCLSSLLQPGHWQRYQGKLQTTVEGERNQGKNKVEKRDFCGSSSLLFVAVVEFCSRGWTGESQSRCRELWQRKSFCAVRGEKV